MLFHPKNICIVLLTFVAFFEILRSSPSLGRIIRPRPPKKSSGLNITQDFIFIATSSKLIRPHSVYPIILSLEKAQGSVDFDFAIKSSREGSNTSETVAKGQFTLEPDTSAVVELKIEILTSDETYNVTVKAQSKDGKIATDYGLIYLDRKAYSIIIQTDKPIYKPGERVNFRIIFVDRFLKPVEIDLDTRKVTIEIFDAQRNVIKSWKGKDIPLRKKYGFVKDKILLSKEPNLGDWSIEVSSGREEGEEERQTHSFSVDQYVLPKFKVDLKTTPNFVTFNQSAFTVNVKPTYTHGKGVQGPCTLLLKPMYEPYYEHWPGGNSENEEKRPRSVSKTKEVDGSAVVEFDLKTDLKILENDATEYGMDYVVEASCTEKVTGKVQNATIPIKLYKFPWKIAVVKQPATYKPGFPLIMVIKVSTHDDIPVSDENPEALKIRHGFAYNSEDGVLYKSIPADGLVTLNFTPPSNEMINVNGVEASYKGLTQWLSVPSRQISPTNSYMVVSILNEMEDKLLVGNSVAVQVKVNKPFDSLIWILIAKGVVIKWDRVVIHPEPSKEYNLSVPLEASAVPEAHLLVYTVLPQKEDLVADTIKLEVKGLEDKQIKVTIPGYSDLNKTVEPGTNITITCDGVWSEALLAVRAVDQSVLLLKEDKDVDIQKIKEVEQEFQNSMSSTRSWGGSDSFQIFENLGQNILTNALITKNEYPVYRHRYKLHSVGFARNRGFHVKHMKMKMAPMAMALEMDSAPSGRAFSANGGEGGAAGPGGGGGGGGSEPVIRIRSSFPESWIFREYSGEDMKEIKETVPDTITSWVINAFQISPTEGLGLSRSSSKLTVFRPFFIVLNVPYSVIKGEVFTLKVLVYNYLGKPVGAKVTLNNAENAFALTEGDLVQQLESIESVGVVSFLISPSKIGTINLSLKAVTSTNEAGDALTQPLIVKPPGVKQSKNDAFFINLLKKKSITSKTMNATFPESRVPDADMIRITVTGDILGGVLNNLNSLVQMPCGCGEQNMINFVPDIVVLDYLKVVEALTPDIKGRAVQYLESGYQRELTFKRYDGSYSAFGNSDNSGSTWLTSFVVRSFIMAKRYISIDNNVILSGLNFLVDQQSENGSFLEHGYVHDTVLLGGSGGSPTALTAFSLLAFVHAKSLPYLQNKDDPKDYSAVLDSGLQWLLKNTAETHDMYSIVLVCYLLHLLDHPSKDHYFEMMEERALTDTKGNYKFWESTKRKDHTSVSVRRKPIFIDEMIWDPWYHDSVKPASVEITSYALLTYLMREVKDDSLNNSISIGRWLLKQRNECGGFISTQDTVVGLAALAKLAEATYSREYQMEVKVTPPGSPPFSFYIGKDNTTTLQEYFLPPGVTKVDVEANGIGTALVQFNWIYYTLNGGNNSGFNLDVNVEPKDKNRRLEMSICTSYYKQDKSNMAILEINSPSGFAFDSEELVQLKSNSQVKRFETEDSDSKLNIYFEFLTKTKTCVTVLAHRIHLVAKYSKPSVAIYDYYDTTLKVTKFYDPPEVNVCQICGLDDSCKANKCG